MSELRKAKTDYFDSIAITVVGWVDGSLTFYVDGQQDGAETILDVFSTGSSTHNAIIGAARGNSGSVLNWLSGAVDDLQVYDRPLNQQEVNRLASGQTPQEIDAMNQQLAEVAVASRGLAHYDYGFRIYNPALGRFLSVDPLTKSYPILTPYQFASNTPIMAIDLDGLERYVVIFRTFIPYPKVRVPDPFATVFGGQTHHGGDNRFLYKFDAGTSFRTEQMAVFDLDQNDSWTFQIGNRSKGFNHDRLVEESKSTNDVGFINASILKGAKDGQPIAQVDLKLEATNKLAKKYNVFTPSINAEFQLYLIPNEDGSTDYFIENLKTDGFPAYELWLQNEDKGETYLLFQQNPDESGQTIFSLYGSGENEYDFIFGSTTFDDEGEEFNFKQKPNIKENSVERNNPQN